MKRIVLLFLWLLFFSHPLLNLNLPHSFVMATSETVYLSEKEIQNNLYIKNAKNIIIDGNLNNEAYLLSDNIVINGNVSGDFTAVARTININGQIKGKAQLIGEHIAVNGQINRSLFYIASQFVLGKNGRINGNCLGFASSTQILGLISEEVQITSADIFFNSSTQKNAKLFADNLNISQEASFSADLEYRNATRLNLKKQVIGKVRFSPGKNIFSLPDIKKIFWLREVNNLIFWFGFLNYLIIGLLLTFIFPRQFANINRFIGEKPIASAVAGIIFYSLSPFLFLVFIFTIVGIPLALLFLLFVFILIYLSRIVAAIFIGSKILNDQESKFIPLLIGLSIIQLVSLLPYVGFLAKIVIVFLSTGAILLSKFGKYSK